MQECLLKATDFGKHLRLKSDFKQTDLEQLSSGEVANSRLQETGISEEKQLNIQKNQAFNMMRKTDDGENT